jgi:H/ACA ribonucleoprotein complex subunit 2
MALTAISDPLAEKSLSKKIVSLGASFSEERLLRRGVKEVVKALRRKRRGIVVLAGDISPIDLISHIPIMCEDLGIPYCYVKSKEFLGKSTLSKNPTTVIMFARPSKTSDHRDAYKELFSSITEINPYLA